MADYNPAAVMNWVRLESNSASKEAATMSLSRVRGRRTISQLHHQFGDASCYSAILLKQSPISGADLALPQTDCHGRWLQTKHYRTHHTRHHPRHWFVGAEAKASVGLSNLRIIGTAGSEMVESLAENADSQLNCTAMAHPPRLRQA